MKDLRKYGTIAALLLLIAAALWRMIAVARGPAPAEAESFARYIGARLADEILQSGAPPRSALLVQRTCGGFEHALWQQEADGWADRMAKRCPGVVLRRATVTIDPMAAQQGRATFTGADLRQALQESGPVDLVVSLAGIPAMSADEWRTWATSHPPMVLLVLGPENAAAALQTGAVRLAIAHRGPEDSEGQAGSALSDRFDREFKILRAPAP